MTDEELKDALEDLETEGYASMAGRFRAHIAALTSERDEAAVRHAEEMEAWKDSTGLECGGDPDGVTPNGLRCFIDGLEHERDALRERVKALEAEVAQLGAWPQSPRAAPAPSEMDGLRGEMAERPVAPEDACGDCGRHVDQHRDGGTAEGCSARNELADPPAEPTVAEAFATVRLGFKRSHDEKHMDAAEAALSLLERRMGAMAWAIRDALAAFEVDYPEDAVHKALPLLKAALTDAPPILALEEAKALEKRLGNEVPNDGAQYLDGWLDALSTFAREMERLAALRR